MNLHDTGTEPWNADTDREDEMNADAIAPSCPMCDGPGNLLGQLGNRVHYRCRNCGADFSVQAPPLPRIDDTEDDECPF